MSDKKKNSNVEKKSLNKFENTRLLSARAFELSAGAKPKIDVGDGVLLGRDYVEVAKKELEAGVLDLEIYK